LFRFAADFSCGTTNVPFGGSGCSGGVDRGGVLFRFPYVIEITFEKRAHQKNISYRMDFSFVEVVEGLPSLLSPLHGELFFLENRKMNKSLRYNLCRLFTF
jgi:hypothetical protein